MKKTLFACSIFLLLFSCKNIGSISKNEDAGIKDVLNFFGGYCEYSIEVSYSSDEGSKKNFELKLSKSKVVDEYASAPEASASNAAYRFYRNLKNEAKKYNEIHVVLIFKDLTTYKAVYKLDQLEEAQQKMKVVNQVVSLIKDKKFDQLKPLMSDNAYADKDKDQVIANLKTVDPEFGNLKSFELFGFRPQTVNNYDLIEFFGIMMRDKQNNEFLVKVDKKVSEDKVMFLDYKFPFKVK